MAKYPDQVYTAIIASESKHLSSELMSLTITPHCLSSEVQRWVPFPLTLNSDRRLDPCQLGPALEELPDSISLGMESQGLSTCC